MFTLEQQKTSFEVSYEERISKSTNKPYKCLIVNIGKYQKTVLLSVPEVALVESELTKNNTKH